MRTLNVIIWLFLFTTVNSQTFHSLNGIESSQSETILLYRLGEAYLPFNPVYKFNTESSTEELIMDAYYSNFPGGEMAKSVLDFEFFPGDDTNFMNVGLTIYPDHHYYIARNDTTVLSDFPAERVDISKQDPLKVFVFGGHLLRSWDGGYTFPIDSIPPVTNLFPISLAGFDDNVLFEINELNQLAKNGSVVDTSTVYIDFHTQFFYDVNQFHVYRINKTIGGYAYYVSNNKGEAYTWTKTYQSENPLYISIDPSVTGLVYLADGRKIYKSGNNGYTFSLYRNLPGTIQGIYKKPGAEKLYAATKTVIYEITPDSVKVIKTLPLAPDIREWFPLAIGNRWVFDSFIIEDNQGFPPFYHFVGTRYMDVVKDTLINNESWFVVELNILNQLVYNSRMFLRIDTTTGQIIRYWEEFNNEYPFYNLAAEVGDTIYYPPDLTQPYYILADESEVPFWDTLKVTRSYIEEFPCSCGHLLVKGIGLGHLNFWEFGGAEDRLKGAVIDGVVYGDTTFVVNIDDQRVSLPTEFKLFQNYPNPFNPSTVISWQSPVQSHQTLKVYDMLGKEVATLVDEERPAGKYEVTFDASGLASGVYVYELRAGDFIRRNKMMYLK